MWQRAAGGCKAVQDVLELAWKKKRSMSDIA